MYLKVSAIFLSLLFLISALLPFVLPSDYKIVTDMAVNYLVLNYNETVGLFLKLLMVQLFGFIVTTFLPH
mgnify:CR=1 FL=1